VNAIVRRTSKVKQLFATQSQAKRFLVEKIVTQAVHEGSPLTEAERRMLSFSETDPESPVDRALVAQLEAEETDEQYEAKVTALLRRSYRRDVASDAKAGNLYREAHRVLRDGDHYLLVMLDRAFGHRSESLAVAAKGLRLLFGCAALVIAAALLLVVIATGDRAAEDRVPLGVASLLVGAAGAYLIRNAVRREA
jgi:hypothetical protein